MDACVPKERAIIATGQLINTILKKGRVACKCAEGHSGPWGSGLRQTLRRNTCTTLLLPSGPTPIQQRFPFIPFFPPRLWRNGLSFNVCFCLTSANVTGKQVPQKQHDRLLVFVVKNCTASSTPRCKPKFGVHDGPTFRSYKIRTPSQLFAASELLRSLVHDRFKIVSYISMIWGVLCWVRLCIAATWFCVFSASELSLTYADEMVIAVILWSRQHSIDLQRTYTAVSFIRLFGPRGPLIHCLLNRSLHLLRLFQ